MAFGEKTFSLKDLDEKFWEKVILIEKWNSSGLGGWGCLWVVTLDKKVFWIGFEGFPYDEHKLEEFSPIFVRKEKIEDYKHPYEIEGKGWHYIYQGQIFIRDDFYDAFIDVYNEEKKGSDYLFIPNVAGKELGAKGELERFDLDEPVRNYFRK